MSDSHTLATKDNVTLEDLAQTPSIQGSKNNYLRQLIHNALAQAGLSNFPVAVESDHFAVMLSSLYDNLGFLCMLQRTETISPFTEKLVRLKTAFSIPNLQLRQIVPTYLQHDPFIKDTTSLLTRTLHASTT